LLLPQRLWWSRSDDSVGVKPALCRLPELVIMDNSPYFHYVAVAMSSTLSRFGISHAISRCIHQRVIAAPNGTANAPANATGTFITFTTHELKTALPKHYISYSFEQLTTDKEWSEEFWQRLR
jgi:hypothetical protein